MSAALPATAATPERILSRLEWRVIRRLDGLFQGDYRTLFFGAGIDFADLREYQPQDDIRHIDWNVTARMDHPYVRQYLEDREITAWFLIDRSQSMTFGPTERSKQMVLIDFVATLARLLTRSGNRVGAILYNNGVERTIPPNSGRNQVLRLIHDLQRAPDAAPAPTTELAALLTAGLYTFRRRSLVFVLSDFISQPGWERPLALLKQRHELIAVRLWDPREETLPDAGMLVFQDAETGENLYIDTSDPVFRRRFREVAARRAAELEASTRQAGVDLFALSTEEDVAAALMRMAALRKRIRR